MKLTILAALLNSALVLGGTVNGRITDEVTGGTITIEGRPLGASTENRGKFTLGLEEGI